MRPQAGFRTAAPTANGVISAKRAWLSGWTVANGSGAAITVTLYDDATNGGTNLIETIVVPAGQTVVGSLNVDTQNGLSVRSTSFATVGVSVRWQPA